MALYWPEQKVALDIIDDPCRHPFEGDDDYTVIRVTIADIKNYETFTKISRHLAELLGKEVPHSAEWIEGNQQLHAMLCNWVSLGDDDVLGTPGDYEEDVSQVSCNPFEDWVRDDMYEDDFDQRLKSVEILATSSEEAQLMSAAARSDGHHVRKVNVWEGPVPEGSFEAISAGMRMSTPEYFFFRKANQLPFAEAVQLGCELCGKFRTSLTQYDAEDSYDFLMHPRTSTARIRTYLRGARGTKECKRARRVLRFVADEASSPMASFLYLHLCLSRSHGGYGIPQAEFSRVFGTDDGLAPSSASPYLAYDLAWPSKQVALQYVGHTQPSEEHMHALEAGLMSVVCVTDDDVSNAKSFDHVARKLARLLDVDLPQDTDKWRGARIRLRHQIEVPVYDHMRITIRDIEAHKADD